jgi:hypothetical protein
MFYTNICSLVKYARCVNVRLIFTGLVVLVALWVVVWFLLTALS